MPRNTAEEKIHQIDTPAICHGLVRASHLNGKLGEARGMKHDDTGIIQVEVHFWKRFSIQHQ